MSFWDNKPRKTEEEIKTLALDFHAGKVYTDRHLSDPNAVMQVFMPIVMGGLKDVSEDDMMQIGLIYEYLEKADPRSVNGMPTFRSFQYLHKDDVSLLFEKLKKIEEALANI